MLGNAACSARPPEHPEAVTAAGGAEPFFLLHSPRLKRISSIEASIEGC